MSQRNILSINVGIGDGQNVQHKSGLNVQGSQCHRDKMLQWTFWLGQNVTVDVVNLDVSSRHPPWCLCWLFPLPMLNTELGGLSLFPEWVQDKAWGGHKDTDQRLLYWSILEVSTKSVLYQHRISFLKVLATCSRTHFIHIYTYVLICWGGKMVK